jgi:CubicO group peptidase (beta-lactamase class C family)
MRRRFLLAAAGAVLAAPALAQPRPELRPRGTSGDLSALRVVAVAREGETVLERGYGGFDAGRPSNVKSASKSVMAALAGAAVQRGLLDGPDQRVAPILEDLLPTDPDPRLSEITVGHLMSMRAGLRSTSGPRYGEWVSSRDWVRTALAQPFTDEPGGRMVYSTGTSHILSAVLGRVAGRDLLDAARDWLGPVEGFAIDWWERDRQGRRLGGNQMSMTAASLLAFGELHRRGGDAVLPEGWVEDAWTPRGRSRWTGAGYGWGWFLAEARLPGGTHDVAYGWGYGGQMIYVVPSLDLSIAILSDETQPSARTGYRDRLHRLALGIMERVEAGEPVEPPEV